MCWFSPVELGVFQVELAQMTGSCKIYSPNGKFEWKLPQVNSTTACVEVLKDDSP